MSYFSKHIPKYGQYEPRSSTCQVETCLRPVLARNYCSLHYQRWHKRGNTDVFIREKKTAQEQISDHISLAENGCWLWEGALNPSGYGAVNGQPVNGKINTQAHRHSYEVFVGTIPEGMELDHLCKNRRCVNPDHLEPVTHLINVRRGDACRATDTHCANGHLYEDGTWRRVCILCHSGYGKKSP